MFRLEYRVVRAVDKVVMGVLVMYTRRGGDFPMGPMHDSYFSCPEKASLEQSIFVKGN
jgi:hypothetical protein